MRVVLFTGKGGVGKTTSAAAASAALAARGRKTLVISSDPAHSLADAFGVVGMFEPTEVAPHLFAMQVSTERMVAESWSAIHEYLQSVLTQVGVGELAAQQLLAPPGLAEICALLALGQHASSGAFDAVIVDCAPTADALRLLSLPTTISWLTERLTPRQRAAGWAARALAAGPAASGGFPLPSAAAVGALRRLGTELADIHALLCDRGVSSIRLVTAPEAVVVAETRRMFTALHLYGFAVDGVIVNRLIPTDGDDPWRRRRATAQGEQLAVIRDSFAAVPIFTTCYQADEPIGVRALGELANATYRQGDVLPPAPATPVLTITEQQGGVVISVPLPLADRRELELSRVADELVVTHAGQRRIVTLPRSCRDQRVAGADLVDGRLAVRFVRE